MAGFSWQRLTGEPGHAVSGGMAMLAGTAWSGSHGSASPVNRVMRCPAAWPCRPGRHGRVLMAVPHRQTGSCDARRHHHAGRDGMVGFSWQRLTGKPGHAMPGGMTMPVGTACQGSIGPASSGVPGGTA